MKKLFEKRYIVLEIALALFVLGCTIVLLIFENKTLNEIKPFEVSSEYKEEKQILEDMQLESVSTGLAILWDENGLYCEGMLPVNLIENSPLIPVTRQDHVRYASEDGMVWINGTSFAFMDYSDDIEMGVFKFEHEDGYVLNLVKQVSALQCLVASGKYSAEDVDTYADWYGLLSKNIAVGNSVLCFGPMQTPVSNIVLYDGAAQIEILDTDVLVAVSGQDMSGTQLETVGQIGEFLFQTNDQFKEVQEGMNAYFIPMDGYYLEVIAPNVEILVTLFGNIAE